MIRICNYRLMRVRARQADNSLLSGFGASQCLDAALDEVEDMRRLAVQMSDALALARSVIQSGEPWTATCEEVIGGALSEVHEVSRRGFEVDKENAFKEGQTLAVPAIVGVGPDFIEGMPEEARKAFAEMIRLAVEAALRGELK